MSVSSYIDVHVAYLIVEMLESSQSKCLQIATRGGRGGVNDNSDQQVHHSPVPLL